MAKLNKSKNQFLNNFCTIDIFRAFLVFYFRWKYAFIKAPKVIFQKDTIMSKNNKLFLQQLGKKSRVFHERRSDFLLVSSSSLVLCQQPTIAAFVGGHEVVRCFLTSVTDRLRLCQDLNNVKPAILEKVRP